MFLSLVGHIRSSERSTETFGHWSDTVHRQRRSTETFCHWLDTADRQKGVHRRLVAG